MTRPAGAQPRIAIIGTGFSGLCLAIHLKQAGIESFTLFERAERIGGTWRDNTYPGAACDLPSMAYCFSFEQKTDWSRKWSPQEEILEYMEHCARKYELLPHIRFGTEIARARFDEDDGCWTLRTATGEEIEAEIVVSGVGQLSRPFTPDIPGLAAFGGDRFHSACWNHDVDLTGKDVAVIGNAASAIQFIPKIAPHARRLRIFQRSANWMMPRRDRSYSEAEKRRFTRFPWLARLVRWSIWLAYELQFPVFRRNRFMASRYEAMSKRYVRETVEDPALRRELTPDYPIGGKRILISDDYYQTLNRENVDVVSDRIDHIDEHAVVTEDGTAHAADVLIVATGFESTRFLAPMRIEGRDGRVLEEDWKDGARAFLGLTVSGYPNFFMMYGPNTNLGHNSIIFMIECQTAYIMDCVRKIIARNLRYIDLRPEAMDAFNEELQADLRRTAWAVTGKSWYKTESGRITNNWSSTTTRYWWKTRRADLSVYEQVARSRPDQLTPARIEIEALRRGPAASAAGA